MSIDPHTLLLSFSLVSIITLVIGIYMLIFVGKDKEHRVRPRTLVVAMFLLALRLSALYVVIDVLKVHPWIT